jgi:hypothetical protein
VRSRDGREGEMKERGRRRRGRDEGEMKEREREGIA